MLWSRVVGVVHKIRYVCVGHTLKHTAFSYKVVCVHVYTFTLSARGEQCVCGV